MRDLLCTLATQARSALGLGTELELGLEPRATAEATPEDAGGTRVTPESVNQGHARDCESGSRPRV